MATIIFKIGDNLPSREGIWRTRDEIFGALMKKDFNIRSRHVSAVIVEVTKYLCMSR